MTNTVDGITRGLRPVSLADLYPSTSCPDLLWEPPDQWPTLPAAVEVEVDPVEHRGSTFIGIALEAQQPDLPEPRI